MSTPLRDSAQARRYADKRYRLFLGSTGLQWVVLLAWHASGASRALGDAAESVASHPAAALTCYLAVFGVVSWLVHLPLGLYAEMSLERGFGLSRMTWPQWWRRELKRAALASGLSLGLLQGLYWLLREAPRHWPVLATIGWVFLSVVLSRVFPTVILPLFYKTVPLQDLPLVSRLRGLCRRVGLPVLGVFRVDLGVETRKANAALAGLGRSRRVLLSDTLLKEFAPEEIEGVLAHELGHQRYRHITKFLVLSAAGTWLILLATQWAAGRWAGALGLAGLADPRGFPVLALWLSVVGFAGLPLQNAISRAFEWQADRFAMATTGQPEAFAEALRRLAALNLSDPKPPRWATWLLYDHPPIEDRIAAASAHVA